MIYDLRLQHIVNRKFQIVNCYMDEQELPSISITEDDISEANSLSLNCPICASAVEANTGIEALIPVVCAKCGTLYHRACWQQGGGKCAILGCGHDKYKVHGSDTRPILTIKYTDLPKASPNGAVNNRTKELKEEQKRQVEQMRRPGFWQRFWKWLLDQIRIG